jgi:hypothetical protein
MKKFVEFLGEKEEKASFNDSELKECELLLKNLNIRLRKSDDKILVEGGYAIVSGHVNSPLMADVCNFRFLSEDAARRMMEDMNVLLNIHDAKNTGGIKVKKVKIQKVEKFTPGYFFESASRKELSEWIKKNLGVDIEKLLEERRGKITSEDIGIS